LASSCSRDKRHRSAANLAVHVPTFDGTLSQTAPTLLQKNVAAALALARGILARAATFSRAGSSAAAINRCKMTAACP
jgi:hypothetical protein